MLEQNGSMGQFAQEDDAMLQKCDQIKLFKLIHELIEKIQSHKPEVAMKLALQAASAINRTTQYGQLEELAYEFCSQALLIFQDDIGDAEQKAFAINLICATIFNLNCFSQENLDTLLANCMSSCA